MSGIVISKEFAYPAAAAVSTFWLLLWQTFRVGRARKGANVDYPQVYAEKAEAAANQAALKFNCAQRAHQNTLENIPIILTGTIITGLKYPVLAASLCGAWTFSRIFYTIGYSSGDPKKQYLDGNVLFGSIGMLGLLLGSTATVVSFVRAL